MVEGIYTPIRRRVEVFTLCLSGPEGEDKKQRQTFTCGVVGGGLKMRSFRSMCGRGGDTKNTEKRARCGVGRRLGGLKNRFGRKHVLDGGVWGTEMVTRKTNVVWEREGGRGD